MEKKNMVTKISDGFCSVERTVTWIAFAIMLALMVIQVLCRFVLKTPLAWSEELIRYTYVGVSFTGAIVAVRERSHIGIDVVLSLTGKIKNAHTRMIVEDALDIFSNVVQVVFFIFIAKLMIDYNIDIKEKMQLTTALQWPVWYFCLPVSASCILMAFHAVLNTLESLIDIFKPGKKGGALVNE